MIYKIKLHQQSRQLLCAVLLSCFSMISPNIQAAEAEPQLALPKQLINEPLKITKNHNPESTETRFYPNYRRESYLGKDQQLRLVYGVKDEQGFYEIANIAAMSYMVTIVRSDNSRHHYQVEGFSQTQRYYFHPARHIKTWLYKEYTSPEVLDSKPVGQFRFGWRTFETHKQFRIHNQGTDKKAITFYSDLNGADAAQTVELAPKTASKWFDYPGGSLITNY